MSELECFKTLSLAEAFSCKFILPSQDTLMEGVKHYFGGGAAAMNLHERIADLLLMELSFSMEDPGKPLQEKGHHYGPFRGAAV